MKKNQIIIFLFLILILNSCENNTLKKINNPNDSDEYLFESNDKEMNDAILKARMTFKIFEAALKNPKKAQSNFTVKYPFDYEGGQEHLWLVDIKIDSNRYFGYIGNDPELAKTIKYNQKVEFKPDSISDWKFFDDKKLIGGYTIKVIYNRMTEKEKEQFMKDNGFKPE